MNSEIKNDFKKLPKYLLGILIAVIISIILGTVSMIAVFALPLDNIKENVKLSSETLYKEGENYSLTTLCASKLDNFTDSIMLANAAYDGDEDLIDKSMHVYMHNLKNQGRLLPLYNYEHGINTEDFHSEGYERYWHGYLVFLKPILMITDYQAIRIINLVLQTLINIAIVFLLYKKKLSMYIAPYILSICFIMPLATAFSMQYATVFYIFSIASIILLCSSRISKNKLNLLILFTLTGVATAFFDFLTYPIATFGMISVIYYCMNDSMSLQEKIYNGALTFGSWGFGYAGMWGGKWIIGSLLTGSNMVSSALGSVETRTSHVSGRGEFSLISVYGKNILIFIKTPVMIFAIVFILIMAYMIFIKYKNKKLNLTLAIPFIILAILPLLWYTLAANHSFLHIGFTYKSLIVSAFAGLCMFANIYKDKKFKKEIKQ